MRTQTDPREPLLDSRAVASFLAVPAGTLDQWAYLGKGPAYMKIGRYRRYRREDVDAWLVSQRRGGDAA